MTIHRLQIGQFRNLNHVRLAPSTNINVIYGDNGSGKTSVLESIFFLTHGRSFKASKTHNIIQQGFNECTVFATVGEGRLPVGVQRNVTGQTEIRISGEPVSALSELASLLPVQFINAEAFQILEGSPRHRRQFLDWGVFHVEQKFLGAWRSAQKALKHRNTLLRSGRIDAQELAAWEHELVHYAHEVDALRSAYLSTFEADFLSLLESFGDIPEVRLSYQRGWDKTRSLSEVLTDSLDRDRKRGFTQSGPQRADLKVKTGKEDVSDILSRGQQKIVVSALKLAQGRHLVKNKEQKRCIYLLDDLPAELDRHHLQKVCQVLEGIDAQVFITCIDPAVFDGIWQDPDKVKMFHVEQGKLN